MRRAGEGEDVMAMIPSRPALSPRQAGSFGRCPHQGESGHGAVVGLKSPHSEVEPRPLLV